MLIHVPYLVSFAGPEAIGASGLVGFLQEETPEQEVIDVEDGESFTLDASWAGREIRDDEVMSALEITSAGTLLPTYDAAPSKIDNPDPVPVMGGEEGYVRASAMAGILRRLESFKTYSAMYALLHADTRKVISFDALACFYVSMDGPPQTKVTLTVFSTDVVDIT